MMMMMMVMTMMIMMTHHSDYSQHVVDVDDSDGGSCDANGDEVADHDDVGPR